jgi:hypothetical protein
MSHHVTTTRPPGVLGRMRQAVASDAPAKDTDERTERTPADVLAEITWYEKIRMFARYGGIIIGVLALISTTVNVQVFASAGHQPSMRTDLASMQDTLMWLVSWLLDPMASLGLVIAIVLESALARKGRHEPSLIAAEIFAGGMTWVMNVWPAVAHPGPNGAVAGVFTHSLAPGLVLLLGIAGPRALRGFSAIIDELKVELAALNQEIKDAAQALVDQDLDERKAALAQEAADRQADRDAETERLNAKARAAESEIKLVQVRNAPAVAKLAMSLRLGVLLDNLVHSVSRQAAAAEQRAEAERKAAAAASRRATREQTQPASSGGAHRPQRDLGTVPTESKSQRTRAILLGLVAHDMIAEGEEWPNSSRLGGMLVGENASPDDLRAAGESAKKVLGELRRPGHIPPDGHRGPWIPADRTAFQSLYQPLQLLAARELQQQPRGNRIAS